MTTKKTNTLDIGSRVSIHGKPYHAFTFSDVETIALYHRQEISKRNYSHVIALMRGGAYLATMVSQFCSIPMTTISYDRVTSTASCPLPACKEPTRVLVCEDVAGKGVTLMHCLEKLKDLGYQPDVFCIASDSLSRMQPLFSHHLTNARPLFPWERSVAGMDLDPLRNVSDIDQDQWVSGFDMDGVFLPDLPDLSYAENLHTTLSQREQLKPYDSLPSLWRKGSPIISGRLESDRASTMLWLHQHGISVGELYLRPHLDVDPAYFKATKCIELRLSEFIESDLGQARTISTLAPHIAIWQYDGSTGRIKRT